MKQLLQNLGNGETSLVETAVPIPSRQQCLIATERTLVSLGTEKMLLDFGKGGWLAKARSQPDKVKQVLQKIKTDGLWTTLDAVKAKLDQPIPLGYSNVGRVLETGAESGFAVGDRVLSNGSHAEVVCVPKHLMARVPDNVSDDQAAFTVVGAIGLQGIRLLNPTIGERFVVSGLGLIGLLCVQMLRANGCAVLGIDFDPSKLELARQFGAEVVDLSVGQDPVAAANEWTGGVGVDGVLITASTKSDELIHQAATMCRRRGRIVLVGVIGLNLLRSDFYEKELTFQVSCSYGPGRYDPVYEGQGLDYPIGFVRWTEQRNFQAVLDLMSSGQVDPMPLISHRFRFDQALDAYQVVGTGNALGILLEYDSRQFAGAQALTRSVRLLTAESQPSDRPRIAFLGAGAFSTRMLLPIVSKLPVRLQRIASNGGTSGAYAARKFGFAVASTDAQETLQSDDVDAVFVTTTHRSHAKLALQSLQAGKHVFVEKPLAMTLDELNAIRQEIESPSSPRRPILMVGFNRRFSPHTEKLRSWLRSLPGPKSIVITVNAGAVPAEHWTQDPEIGGGRIVGEACHFIDLARSLVEHPIVDSSATYLRGFQGRLGDSAALQLVFADGSIGTVHYLANGDKSFPKERIEVFASGKVLVCDNFRRTFAYGIRGGLKTRSQDKGHTAELKKFVEAVASGGPWPISAEELFEVSEVAIRLARSPRIDR